MCATSSAIGLILFHNRMSHRPFKQNHHRATFTWTMSSNGGAVTRPPQPRELYLERYDNDNIIHASRNDGQHNCNPPPLGHCPGDVRSLPGVAASYENTVILADQVQID